MEEVTAYRKYGRRAVPIISAFQQFLSAEESGGVLLIIATLLALTWANSPWAQQYSLLWHTPVSFGAGELEISKPLLLWINEGLMAIFFLYVGLEIKRELLIGELSTPRRALFPIVTALGGMLVPAVIYLALNAGGSAAAGWGIPMATDIAFALGVLSLLGRRVPLQLKIFLTAVAIADDLGSVLVIALFYSSELVWLNLFLAALIFTLLLTLNRLGLIQPVFYGLLGAALWLAFLESGIHATVAGVLLALTIPASTRIDAREFLEKSRAYLAAFERAGESGHNVLTNREQRAALQALETAAQLVEPPLQRLEHALRPWVAYGIMPLFAFANAGVSFTGDSGAALRNPIGLGILAGLVLGKQIGITSFAWIFSRLGWIEKPGSFSWRQLYGAGVLGGIGFTMSLFIASLAFGESPELAVAKFGILAASLTSALLGWLILVGLPRGRARRRNMLYVETASGDDAVWIDGGLADAGPAPDKRGVTSQRGSMEGRAAEDDQPELRNA